MFPAVKALNRKNFECPKVEDSDGKLITNPNSKIAIIRVNTVHLEPETAEPTNNKIRNKVKFQPVQGQKKSPGADQIYPELLQYSTLSLDQTIVTINCHCAIIMAYVRLMS